MKQETRKFLLVAAALVVTMALSTVIPLIFSDYVTRVILLIGLNSVLVLSLSLSNGFTGVFSLGHVGFIGAGAYVSGIVSLSTQQKLLLLPHLPALVNSVHLSFLPATLFAGAIDPL